jgi:hypothetical protein
MVAAQSAPAPPRRKRGGRPAGCSAVILVWLLAVAGSAHAAAGPAPDPAPTRVQPDAAPGSSTTPPARQPVTSAPVTVQSSPVVQQPVQTATAPTTATPATVAAKPTGTKAKEPNRARARARAGAAAERRRRAHAAAAERTTATHRASANLEPRAVGAARRVATVLAFKSTVQRQALSDGELYAAATLLLLFVAAAASVLRLSTRISGESPTGRFG